MQYTIDYTSVEEYMPPPAAITHSNIWPRCDLVDLGPSKSKQSIYTLDYVINQSLMNSVHWFVRYRANRTHARTGQSENTRCGNSPTALPPDSCHFGHHFYSLLWQFKTAGGPRNCGNFEGSTPLSPLHKVVWRKWYRMSQNCVRPITFFASGPKHARL